MKKILVTGANSGIGKSIVDYLLQKDCYIYATARNPADLAHLKAFANASILKLDVTKQTDIDLVISQIEKDGSQLDGIVNNAGVADIGPIYNYSIQAIKDVFDVNIFGVMRVTHALLPFLRRSQGRIVILSSMSGILSGKYFGIYSISKHAIEAYGDTLSYDLQDTGIHTALIEPGNYKSNMFKKFMKRMDLQTENDHKFESSEEKEKFFKRLNRLMEYEQNERDPIEVAKVVYDGLFSEHPKKRYMVGPKKERDLVINRMIDELLQLNEHDPVSLADLQSRLTKKWNESNKAL